MFAGNDVIAISSLGGASGNFWLRILKVRTRLHFHIHVQLTLFVNLDRFRRYLNVFYLSGISLLGAKSWGFWGKMTPKTSNGRKTLAWRVLPYAKLRLLSHSAWNYLYPFGLCRCSRKQSQEGRSHKKCLIYLLHNASYMQDIGISTSKNNIACKLRNII